MIKIIMRKYDGISEPYRFFITIGVFTPLLVIAEKDTPVGHAAKIGIILLIISRICYLWK